MNTFTVVDGALYQWDTGRKLKIKWENQKDIGEVHFSTVYLTQALVVKPYAEGEELFVNIPNILLQKSCKITVYMVVLLENGEQTICSNTFCVIARKRPADYVYTESEVMTWTTLEAKIPQKLSDLEIDLEIGTDSATYTPFVSDIGELSWTNNKGLPNPAPINVKGEKGTPGDTPYIGENGNWYIGDTDTGTPAGGCGGTPNAVQYGPQTLTGEQQTQARKNIDAQSQVYAVKRANPWSAEDCVNASVRGLKLYGACTQVSSPSPDNPQEIKCNRLTYTLKNDAEYHGGSVTAPSLYGIGDAQDEWDAMTGHGVRKITKIILDGTINYLTKTDNTAGSYLYHFIYNNQGVADIVQNTLCTHFKHVKIAYPNQEGQYTITTKTIFINAKGLVWGDNAVLQNADEINAFLASQSAAGTPVTVYYEMAEAEPFATVPLENPLTTPDGYAQFLSWGDGAAGDIEAEYAVDVEKRYTHKLVTEEILRMKTNDICSFIKFDVKRDYKIIHVYLSTSASNSVLVALSDGTTPIASTLTILLNKTSYSDALLHCVGGFNIISTKGIRYYTALQYTDDRKYAVPKANHIIDAITPNNDSAIYGADSVDYGFNEAAGEIVKAGDYLALVPKTGSVISSGVKVVIVGEYYE
ncbi:MAG: hypothetical protein J6I50_03870 [Clostridia bacterium]|nr:hypothetical protein [Clostridia bacterium]